MSIRRSSKNSKNSKSSKSSKSSKNSKNSKNSKKIQKTIDLLLQSKTDEDANIVLAKITDTDYLGRLYDIVEDDRILSLILVRMIQIKIQQKIEEQLKRYNERRIELEERLGLIRNTDRSHNEAIQLELNEAEKLHRIATEMLQLSLKSGNLHIKQGEIEDAVKRVDERLTVAALRIRLLIDLLIIREYERKKRISRTEVGNRLTQNISKRVQQQQKNRD